MREIRLYGSEGGGAGCSPYPYQTSRQAHWIPAFAGMTPRKIGRPSELSEALFPCCFGATVGNFLAKAWSILTLLRL